MIFNKKGAAMVTKLPTFKGYTVDFRLREFRKAIPDRCLEFVAFDSKKGKRLLTEMSKLRGRQ